MRLCGFIGVILCLFIGLVVWFSLYVFVFEIVGMVVVC